MNNKTINFSPSIPSRYWFQVALDIPNSRLFDYQSFFPINIGLRVIVPFGNRKLIGIIVNKLDHPSIDPNKVRQIEIVLDDFPAFKKDWLNLIHFASDYYQYSLGKVFISVLPKLLRKIKSCQNKSSNKHISRQITSNGNTNHPILNSEQKTAVDTIIALKKFKTILLHGVTGSGKTEVYMQIAEHALMQGTQVLLLVPEISLLIQLEIVLKSRFKKKWGSNLVILMHSGLTNNQMIQAWKYAQYEEPHIFLGTRMAIFLPLSRLGLIIIDEEHDISYKQQDRFRYSARDLAIWRANYLDIPVILGSATPSIETWFHTKTGRYLRLSLAKRIKNRNFPKIRLISTHHMSIHNGLTNQLINAISQRLKSGEQSLLFLNRRGYAPVLHCFSCGWISHCSRCTVFTVLHQNIETKFHCLRCHHCGYQITAPRKCPNCLNEHLKPIGYGTQRLEESLEKIFPGANIIRIDSDSTRFKGSAQNLLNSVHTGKVDILVGTQMISKGHDFSRLSLVGVINSDALLFTQDFRGQERLFSQLMQVSGRAGRHLKNSEVIIQTNHSNHVVYQALLHHDYNGFASYTLKDRKVAKLPPYSYQALLTAESFKLDKAITFLERARSILTNNKQLEFIDISKITCYDPIPLRIVRIANIERAQILIESLNRMTLQNFLKIWKIYLPELAKQYNVRWRIEVDPIEI